MQLPFSLIHLSETTLIFDVLSVIKVLDKTARGGRVSVLLPRALGQRCNGTLAVYISTEAPQKQHWEERYNHSQITFTSVNPGFSKAAGLVPEALLVTE